MAILKLSISQFHILFGIAIELKRLFQLAQVRETANYHYKVSGVCKRSTIFYKNKNIIMISIEEVNRF